MEKGQLIDIIIEDMLDDGRAFGRCEGIAVFVSGGCGKCAGAVPGDTARVEICKQKKNSAEAVLREIVSLSPDRIKAECPYFGECGGCTLQELSYDAQLRLKREQVKSKLERLGGLSDPKVNDVIGARTLKYYRNKAVFAVGPHGEVGFMKGKSHFVMDIEDCMLQSDAAMVCADALRTFLRERGAGNCGIGQMTVRTAFATGEVMVVFEEAARDDGRRKNGKGKKKAGNKFEIPDADDLIEMMDDAVASLNYAADDADPVDLPEDFWSLESVALINKGKCHIMAGKPTITDEFKKSDGGTVRYEISPQSFMQVNPEQMSKLYDKAVEYTGLLTNALNKKVPVSDEKSIADCSSHTVLDLYCGAGTIGIWLLDSMRKKDEEAFARTNVIGIESVKPAVLDANRNSVINNMVNTRYIAGKAEEELPGMMGLTKLYKWNEVNERVEREPEITIEKVDVAILDPPRSGCDEALLDAAVTASPDRIVYVSCDPATLARDIKYLTTRGYEFIECTPIDQFPWTSHCEVTALLKRL